jgi:hypothetical protein
VIGAHAHFLWRSSRWCSSHACGARFQVARASAALCPRPRTTLSALGLVVPVSPYFGADIWQGRGLDGLWVNTRRLIYLLRVNIAILEDTGR